MLTLWDCLNDCEENVIEDRLHEIVKTARLNSGPYGGQGEDVDQVIYETGDDDENEPFMVAWRRNREWEVIPERQSVHAQFTLSHR